MQPKRFFNLAVACTALGVLFLAALHPIQSDDLFMYLTLGRHMREGGLPSIDPYLFALPNHAWHIAHEWGAYWIFDRIFALAGFNWVIVFKALLITGMGLCALWPAILASDHRVVLLLPLAAYAGCLRFSEKASLFSDFLSLFLLLLLTRRSRDAWGVLAFVPLIFLVWINLHPGFYFGFAILALTIVARLLQRAFAEAKRLFWVTVFSLLACLCNPLGWQGVVYPVGKILNPTWQIFRTHFVEWMPTLAEGFYRIAAVNALLLIWCLAAIFLLYNWRKRPYLECIILLFLIGAGVNAVRFMLFSGLGALWVIARQLPEIPWPHLRSRWCLAVVAIEQVVLALILVIWGYPAHSGPMHVGVGISKISFPVGAAAFIEKQGMYGRIFNETDWGSYLIWRLGGSRQVFYHGHIDDPRFLQKEYMAVYRSPEEFHRLVETYKIDMFVLRKRSLAKGHPMAIKPLLEQVQLGVWKIAFYDEMSVVLVR